MTVSIMDGHTGKDHVTSDYWAAFNAATYGNQGAVLGSGSFKLTMETSTKGTLSAGLGIVQGRRFRVTDSETVAFDACGAGMKRSDIVVARYSNADGIESVSIAVVKGKENATSAVSPQVQNGDLPLWNVVFDGVNVYKGYPARVTAPTQSIASAASADSVDALKNSVDALKKSLEINNIDVFVDTDSDGNELLLMDVLTADEPQVGYRLEQNAERAALYRAVAGLSPRERRIMELRFGLGCESEHTQKEVADVLGISQSYISRLEKRILRRLRRELESVS